MNHPTWHWLLAGAALVAGYMSYGWRGLVLALTAIVFWLLLQFNRAVRTLRTAGQAPKGRVGSTVMLHAKLRTGMTMLELLPISGSLGEALDGDADQGRYAWRDDSGRSLTVVFGAGRVVSWTLSPPPSDGVEPVA